MANKKTKKNKKNRKMVDLTLRLNVELEQAADIVLICCVFHFCVSLSMVPRGRSNVLHCLKSTRAKQFCVKFCDCKLLLLITMARKHVLHSSYE